MDRAQLPLNALRAFEAAARHLNISRAALELCVSQGAVSHQIAALEKRLGVTLFRRQPRGLVLTDEGRALVPLLSDMFDRVGNALDFYADGRLKSVLTVGVVGSFAVGWLFERLDSFALAHPEIDLRILTNNNLPDMIANGLDLAIRFGDGAWHSTHAEPLMAAPFAPLCAPRIAARLTHTGALAQEILLRSYRPDEWPRWFAAANCPCLPLTGPLFDSSYLMVSAAIAGAGVALAPPLLFERQLQAETLVQPFDIMVECGRYWLTRTMVREDNDAMAAFRTWIQKEAEIGLRPDAVPVNPA